MQNTSDKIHFQIDCDSPHLFGAVCQPLHRQTCLKLKRVSLTQKETHQVLPQQWRYYLIFTSYLIEARVAQFVPNMRIHRDRRKL